MPVVVDFFTLNRVGVVLAETRTRRMSAARFHAVVREESRRAQRPAGIQLVTFNELEIIKLRPSLTPRSLFSRPLS